jgi:putative SOS response-associated peptidase YedK
VVYRPRWNLAPGDQHWIVRKEGQGSRLVVPAKWGFPTDTSRLLINARVETVAKRPAFRDAYRDRRCLVPADGFYEWRHESGRRGEPFWYHHADGSLLLMAGVFTGGAHPAFTILTMPANDVVAPAHDRMPVVLSPEAARAWLDDPRFDPASSAVRLQLGRDLVARPVSTRVNSAAYDGPECLAPPDPAPASAQLEFRLSPLPARPGER